MIPYFFTKRHNQNCQRVTRLTLTMKKYKVLNGLEPPSGESTTTECGVKYQLLAVIYRSCPMGNSDLLVTVDHNQLRTMGQRLYILLTGNGPYPLRVSCIA